MLLELEGANKVEQMAFLHCFDTSPTLASQSHNGSRSSVQQPKELLSIQLPNEESEAIGWCWLSATESSFSRLSGPDVGKISIPGGKAAIATS